MSEKPNELTDSPNVRMPDTAVHLAKSHPELWEAYQRLGRAVSEVGPLNRRERRLVHLAYALGSTSEGAAHSHVRRASSEGFTGPELEHVALLAVTTLGWSQAVRALSLVHDVAPEK